jgi:serine/threonine protein kinase
MVTPVVRLSRQLGAGGMGSIWLADHLSLKAPVVVKFMSEALMLNADAVDRFSREAMAAAQLRSPHVVQVFDHGVTDGVPYIVMEFLDGRDLGTLIQERGRIEPPALVQIVAQVCKALTKAHAMGIVHRDIKPDNIYICGHDEDEPFVKLLDFGIAKTSGPNVAGVATRTGAILGTPLYMSPEQIASGKTVDARSDIWAMGVVVFEALTGTKPFVADDFGALVLMLHTGETPRPTSANRALPMAIDEWFARACHRHADQRFASITDMFAALRTALQVRTGSDPALGSPVVDAAARSSMSLGPTQAAPAPAAAATRAAGPIYPVTNGGLATTASSLPLRRSTGLWVGAGAVLLLALGLAALGIRGASKNDDPSAAPPAAGAGLVAPAASSLPPAHEATAAPTVAAAPSASTAGTTTGAPATQSLVPAVVAPLGAPVVAAGPAAHPVARAVTAAAQAPVVKEVVALGTGNAAGADAGSAPPGKAADAGKPHPRFNDIE